MAGYHDEINGKQIMAPYWAILKLQKKETGYFTDEPVSVILKVFTIS
jgi:hypothetical protein